MLIIVEYCRLKLGEVLFRDKLIDTAAAVADDDDDERISVIVV